MYDEAYPPLLCFACAGSHRDLHSFPTRRSSDLDVGARDEGLGAGPGDDGALDRVFGRDALGRVAELGHHLVVEGVRSEEHTSELQSHVNLVCRLLLEKKKSAYTTV